MASIVDSIRSVMQDNYSLLKLGGFSALIYLIYGLSSNEKGFDAANLIVYLAIAYLYLGFASIIINNRIHQKIETLPLFDVLLFLNVAVRAFFIAIPYLLVGYYVVNLVVGMFSFEGIPQIISLWMIRYFILSVYVTALIAFADKYEVKDALNISTIVTGAADVMAYTMVSLIFLAVLGVFIVAPIMFLIYNFFEFGALFIFGATFFLSMIIAFLSDYWGQLHYDIESKNNIY